MRHITFRAMGSTINAVIDDDSPRAAAALRDVPLWFEAWEQVFSRFRPTSELSRLNAACGQWVEVSEPLWEVLCLAMQAAAWTDSLVTPTVHTALVRLGYVRDFEALRVGETALPLSERAQPSPDWRRIERDAARRLVRVPCGVALDLGGIAKGWCAAQAAQRLATIAPALVDAGGDIAVAPSAARTTRFPIGVADPHQPESLLAVIGVAGGCVATSGRDYRRWKVGDHEVHHLIDPRTGLPAQTDVLTATVIAPEAWQAEAAAKTLLLLGSEAAPRWLQAQPNLAACLVRDDGQTWHNERFAALLW